LVPLIPRKSLIQIAGVLDQKEADLLVSLKVPFLGFPFELDYHSEDLSPEDSRRIILDLPKTTSAVLITYLKKAKHALDLADYLGTKLVQFHGEISIQELSLIREKRPRLKIIKSIIIGQQSLPQICSFINTYSSVVDAFITDTFDPETGASGATGKKHNWEISRTIVEYSPLPVILAGGLNTGNVREAILKVRPAGVDAHTGVENNDGRKDPDKVRSFIRESYAGFIIASKTYQQKKPPEPE
jgi:phosphoribosylanthranilate isomerase